MSPRKSNETPLAPAPAGVHRKPRPDLYTVLLAIALVAVLVGILFLYLEMQLYEFKIDGGPPVGMASQCLVGWALPTKTQRFTVGGAHPATEISNPQSICGHGCSLSTIC